MSFDHLGLIAELKLPPTHKLVLFALGNRACSLCGISWPGKSYLMEMTGLGETAVVKALKSLVDGEYLTIHRYSHGGRGVATEYVVLPNHLKLTKAAPCNQCQRRMKTPRLVGGLRTRQMSKPPASGVQNPPPGTPHSVIETPFSQTEDPQASPSGSGFALESSEPPPPTNAEDARQRAEAGMRAIIAAGPRSGLQRGPAKP